MVIVMAIDLLFNGVCDHTVMAIDVRFFILAYILYISDKYVCFVIFHGSTNWLLQVLQEIYQRAAFTPLVYLVAFWEIGICQKWSEPFTDIRR